MKRLISTRSLPSFYSRPGTMEEASTQRLYFLFHWLELHLFHTQRLLTFFQYSSWVLILLMPKYTWIQNSTATSTSRHFQATNSCVKPSTIPRPCVPSPPRNSSPASLCLSQPIRVSTVDCRLDAAAIPLIVVLMPLRYPFKP